MREKKVDILSWQKELQQNVTSVEQLLPHMAMTAEEQQRMAAILEQFPMSITPYYLSLIDFNDPEDPIRKLAIPSIAETDLSGSFDTSGEADNTIIPGMQHKYAQTVMMLSTNQCAMYCRHCFRKRLVGLSSDEVATHLEEMREYIMQHEEITNVLVSGGDALLNTNERLRQILEMLSTIPHLDAIRIATRVPVVFPSRISGDTELLRLFAEINEKKQLVVVTHYNHPRELSEQSLRAILCIQKLGIVVKNQTVLLKGINSDPQVLATLLRRLVANGISPYYVFQCRPVVGVKSQFQLSLREGVRVVEQAKALQNGLGKTLHYCMSHVTGKMEILGEGPDGRLLFKYHEAKDPAMLGRILAIDTVDGECWLEDDAPYKAMQG